jgi:hypothetical protein
MDQEIPIIYTPSVQRPTVPLGGRLAALAVSAAMLAVLIIAVRLPPNPDGVGTHQAMGFQKCEFMYRTGLPCPSCGMTTSFAWFVRGNWIASIYVQPMGFVLALLTGGVFWASLYIAVTARPIHRLLQQLPQVILIVSLMGFGIAAWGWKIFIHLRGMDGWR